MEERFELHERSHEGQVIDTEWEVLKEGVRWTCIRCGACCKRSWALNLTWWEYSRLKHDDRASKLNIDKVEVDPQTGATHPYFIIEGECPLLKNGTVCGLYPDWLYTCATYPFLLMQDGTLEVHTLCPGFGHGEVIDHDQMKEKILKERERAGMIVE